MLYKISTCLVKGKINKKFLIASLKTLKNSKDLLAEKNADFVCGSG
jgi:hypothetical protein